MDAKNNDYTNAFFIILNLLTASITFFLALTPFFGNLNPFAPIFVDQHVVNLASIVSVIILIVATWFSSTGFNSFTFFGKRDVLRLTSFRFWAILMEIFIVSIFYASKVLYDINGIIYSITAITQFVTFCLFFLFLSIIIGISLFELKQSLENSKINTNYLSMVKNLLIESNIIESELRVIIRSVTDYLSQPGESGDFQNASLISLQINEEYYIGIFHKGYRKLLRYYKRPEVTTNIETTRTSTEIKTIEKR